MTGTVEPESVLPGLSDVLVAIAAALQERAPATPFANCYGRFDAHRRASKDR
jgi:hypothetical protein